MAIRGDDDNNKSNNDSLPAPISTDYSGGSLLDEVTEFITLPTEPREYKQDPTLLELSPVVLQQLRGYVAAISSLCKDNQFHSFEHCSHVMQSATKMLACIVAPKNNNNNRMECDNKALIMLHKYTYGITSDPLTQFAVIFLALIHDVEHPGVPNGQLVKEDSNLVRKYKNKSVAEQNSVDKAWNLLMEPAYKDLRGCIFQNQSELDRFHQLVVNTVMATDIADKELAKLRQKRWEKAFNTISTTDNSSSLTTDNFLSSFLMEGMMNLKATITIEHLIQASDVAHTMQHWKIFSKWNEPLFHECYHAHLCGRAKKNPAEGWYEGELGFFDHYIIPLANKLKECGVFGVTTDEYLTYAQANRKEWEIKGKCLVEEYVNSYNEEDEEYDLEAVYSA